MFNIGLMELLLIAVLGLLVFGPERLPELARTTAKFLARFRQEAGRSISDLREAAGLDEVTGELSTIRRELGATRDEIASSLRGPVDAIDGAVKQVSPGGPAATPAPPSQVPPMDPEAT